MSDPTWTPAMLAANFESMRLLYLQAEAERATANQENAALTREVAGLRYYIAQLERNVSPEERAYAAQVAQMMLAAQEAQP